MISQIKQTSMIFLFSILQISSHQVLGDSRSAHHVNISTPKVWVISVNSTNIGLYEKFEITVGLENTTYSNPYDPDQIDVQARFTSPSGKEWRIFGFYDNYQNAGQWLVRFAPDEIGEWTYYLSAQDNDGTGQSENYQFSAISSAHHGWMHVSDDNPRYLEYDDGTSFYGVGMCYPWNVYKSGLSRLASFGANIFFYWNGTYDGAGNGGGTRLIESMNSGLGRYDQYKCARIDELIAWSEELNINMVLVMWPHDYFADKLTGWPCNWQSNPYQSLCAAKDIYGNSIAWDYQQKQYRYMIARWGYSRALAAWQVICEISGTDGWASGDQAIAEIWCQKVQDYLKSNDPFRHPTTGSQHGYVTNDWPNGYAIFDMPNREIYESQGWSYDPRNTLRSSYQNYVRVTRNIWENYRKPIISGETGYSLTFVPTGTHEYVQLYHNALWSTLCTGMAGTPFWWAYGGGNIITEEVLSQMKTFAAFTETTELSKTEFEPADIEAPGCDAYGMKSDSIAFGWIRQIDNLNVSGRTCTFKGLKNGAYLITWFNTWTGSDLNSQLRVCFNNTLMATVPTLLQVEPDIAFTIAATAPGEQPAALELFADKIELFNDASDTSTITCVIKDLQGRLCVQSNDEIRFDLDGPGRIINDTVVNAVNGIAMIRYLPDSTAGTIRILATSAGLIPDTLEIAIVDYSMIDDFEGYASIEHLQSYWIPYAGTCTSISLDSQVKEHGSYGMKVDYTIGAPVFAGVYRKIDQDWSRFSAIRMWLKPDGSQRNLAMMIKESNGRIWQYDYRLSGMEVNTMTIPFRDFRRYFGSGDMDLRSISQFIFYITKGSGSDGSGSLYIDEMKVLTAISTGIELAANSSVPVNHRLCQNYPNPFNASTIIRYQLPTSAAVEFAVYDALGKKIRTLTHQVQDSGTYQIEFDATDIASGLYFYQIKAGACVLARKMIILK